MKEANPNNKAMQRTTLKDGAGKKKKVSSWRWRDRSTNNSLKANKQNPLRA